MRKQIKTVKLRKEKKIQNHVWPTGTGPEVAQVRNEADVAKTSKRSCSKPKKTKKEAVTQQHRTAGKFFVGLVG